jgi:hypothetical protein
MPTTSAGMNFFNSFFEAVNEKVHNLGSDTLKVALTNSAPVATNTILANITQISAGNGYTTGGNAITITASSQTAGTYSLVGNNVVFTASGGNIATFRYAVIYNDTATDDPLIGWLDFGSAVDVENTGTFTINFASNSGVILTHKVEV